MTTAKWGKAFWVDLAERAVSSAAYGGITILTAANIGPLSVQLGWTIIGLPTVLSILKSLTANLSGPEPTASLVNVNSWPGPIVGTEIKNALEYGLKEIEKSPALDLSPPA